MNLLSPSTWPGVGNLFRGTKDTAMPSSALLRASQSMGAWQDSLGGFTARDVNPHFYEALREALPILDGAVNRLVTLDGIVRVEGGNEKLVNAITTGLLESIAVNDAEAGLQAAYASQGNELYEQGLGLIEMVMDRKGRELIGLRVADSKGVAFDRDPADKRLRWWYRPPNRTVVGRRDGTDQVEAVLRNRGGAISTGLIEQWNYTQLDPAMMVYAVLQPEADSPYGVSLFRSLEFVSQILLKIQNATGHVWDRFGDPPYMLTYKVKNRAIANDQTALSRRQRLLAQDLAKVLNAKRSGNSADFVNAIAADDDIQVQVIGAKDQVLEIEMPARHMLEQIVSKTGIPAWLLGMQWSTSERLAQQQSEMVLQESRTRWERRLPGLRKVVETWLRGRGLTWKPGDWKLVQELPSLHDELKRAQAAFLNAQTEYMQRGGNSGANLPPPAPGTDQGAAKRFSIAPDGTMEFFGDLTFPAPLPAVIKAATNAATGEAWAQDDAQLVAIEARTITAMHADWHALGDATLSALGVPAPAKRAKAGEVGQAFEFTTDMRRALDSLGNEFEIRAGSDAGALYTATVDAWLRGVENVISETGVADAIRASSDAVKIQLRERGMQQVRNVTTRAFRDDVLQDLSEGAYDGLNPDEVAARLRKRFGAHDYDWERLASTEIAQAQVLGKEAEYEAMELAMYDYVTAGDGKVSSICRSLAEAGPYPVGKGPLPARDSHPKCRCTTMGVIEE